MMAVVERPFFARDPDVVARGLLGKLLVVRDGGTERRARLVETEAYGGADDPASHSYGGSTPRSAIMFGPPGFLYVYRIYGLHWCANVVTGPEGRASAVLLRAAELLAAPDGQPGADRYLRGPGNLTRGLGLTGLDNGIDCCRTFERVWIEEEPRVSRGRVGRSTRVGVSRGRERRSRYFIEGHPAVTRTPRSPSDAPG